MSTSEFQVSPLRSSRQRLRNIAESKFTVSSNSLIPKMAPTSFSPSAGLTTRHKDVVCRT